MAFTPPSLDTLEPEEKKRFSPPSLDSLEEDTGVPGLAPRDPNGWYIQPGSIPDRLLSFFGGDSKELPEWKPGERPPVALPIAKAIDAVTGFATGNRPVMQDLVETTTVDPKPGEPSFTSAGIPTIPQQEGTGKQIAAGLANLPIGFANFLLSPGGVATLQSGGMLPKIGQQLMGLGFTAQQVGDFFNAETFQDKVTSGVGALLLGAATGKSFKSEPPAKPSDVPEAAARPIVPPVQGTESMARYQYPAPEPQPVAVAPVEVPPVERTGNVSEPVPFVPANVAPEGNILPPMRSETQRYSAPEGVPVYPEGNTAADAAAWQRDLVSEGQRLGEQAALIGQRGMRIPTPLASRIAEINAELQRGYQPAEPEHYQMPETLTPEPATTSVLPVAPESVAAPEAAAPVAAPVEPLPPPVRPVPEVPTPPAGPEGVGDPRITGVANRVLSAEAIAGKIGAIEPGEGLSWQEMVDLGRASGINPQEVAQRFKQTGRLSYEEFAALRAERERMAIQNNELADRANAEPWNKDVQQALVNARKLETDFIRNVVQPAKTATSNIFRGMQGEAPIDATTFEGLRRAIVDATGKEPTALQATVIRNRAAGARKIADSEARALKNASRAIEQEFPKTKTPTLEQLKAEMERMAKELMPCKT